MEEQVKMFVELQGLDGEIFDKKRLLDAIPGKIKELDDGLEEKSEIPSNPIKKNPTAIISIIINEKTIIPCSKMDSLGFL